MSKPHVLIIDDNVDNLAVLEELLSLENVQYTSLYNPSSLDEILIHLQDVDIIFVDLEMPHIDGYQIFEELKAGGWTEKVAVAAYTVHVSEMNAARQLGFHSFLGKPLDADQFPAQLARILNGEHVWSIP